MIHDRDQGLDRETPANQRATRSTLPTPIAEITRAEGSGGNPTTALTCHCCGQPVPQSQVVKQAPISIIDLFQRLPWLHFAMLACIVLLFLFAWGAYSVVSDFLSPHVGWGDFSRIGSGLGG